MLVPNRVNFKKIIETNFIEAFKAFANKIESPSYATWITSTVPFPNFNSVIQTSASPTEIEETIKTISEYYQKKSIPFAWFTTELSQPAHLSEILIKNNFKPCPDFKGMILDLQSFPEFNIPESCRIEKLDEPDIRQWADPIQVTWGFSDEVMRPFIQLMQKMMLEGKMVHYMAYYEGKHAGSASAFLGSESLGFYNMSVYPAFQRKHIGTSLQYVRLLLAKSLGYRFAILQAYEFSAKAASNLGFSTVMRFTPYLTS